MLLSEKNARHARRDSSRNVDGEFKKRLENRPGPERPEPMMTASNIHYELADRVQGLSAGGIGAMLLLARNIGLINDIDAQSSSSSSGICPITNPTMS